MSERKSTNTGITDAATSGNLIEQACKVLTRSCLYFPESYCSLPDVLITSFFKSCTISSIVLAVTKSIAKANVLVRTSSAGDPKNLIKIINNK